MPQNISPLRYPGGRAIIYPKIRALLERNNMKDVVYVEPFAGGFGIGLGLLFDNVVKDVILNDYDIHIFHFWHAVLNETDALIDKIENTPITLEERARQKKIYNDELASPLDDGFATLFLNRVNFSGIIKAGAIGGSKQNGKYLLDCRFNKEDIIRKIRCVAKYKRHIKLQHLDAKKLIAKLSKNQKKKYFLYIDPPYVIKGNVLYTKYFKEKDHLDFANAVDKHLKNIPWVMTYDKCELIAQIYKTYNPIEYQTPYYARNKGKSVEYVITNMGEKFYWEAQQNGKDKK